MIKKLFLLLLLTVTVSAISCKTQAFEQFGISTWSISESTLEPAVYGSVDILCDEKNTEKAKAREVSLRGTFYYETNAAEVSRDNADNPVVSLSLEKRVPKHAKKIVVEVRSDYPKPKNPKPRTQDKYNYAGVTIGAGINRNSICLKNVNPAKLELDVSDFAGEEEITLTIGLFGCAPRPKDDKVSPETSVSFEQVTFSVDKLNFLDANGKIVDYKETDKIAEEETKPKDKKPAKFENVKYVDKDVFGKEIKGEACVAVKEKCLKDSSFAWAEAIKKAEKEDKDKKISVEYNNPRRIEEEGKKECKQTGKGGPTDYVVIACNRYKQLYGELQKYKTSEARCNSDYANCVTSKQNYCVVQRDAKYGVQYKPFMAYSSEKSPELRQAQQKIVLNENVFKEAEWIACLKKEGFGYCFDQLKEFDSEELQEISSSVSQRSKCCQAAETNCETLAYTKLGYGTKQSRNEVEQCKAAWTCQVILPKIPSALKLIEVKKVSPNVLSVFKNFDAGKDGLAFVKANPEFKTNIYKTVIQVKRVDGGVVRLVLDVKKDGRVVKTSTIDNYGENFDNKGNYFKLSWDAKNAKGEYEAGKYDFEITPYSYAKGKYVENSKIKTSFQIKEIPRPISKYSCTAQTACVKKVKSKCSKDALAMVKRVRDSRTSTQLSDGEKEYLRQEARKDYSECVNTNAKAECAYSKVC